MNSRREDINDVLNDVIVRINRVTDHLRISGENEAASHFTRDMTTTFRDLFNVVAPWDIEKCLMNPTIEQQKTPQHPLPYSPGNTWASIAATEPVADEKGIIKFRPGDGVKRTVLQQQEQVRGHHPKDRRVVWVRPWNELRALSEISNKMKELGAIYSIAFAPEEHAVCIIFQHANFAVQFLHQCAEHVGRTGISPFGMQQEVTPGLPYPQDDSLRRMEPPHNERRRLTFARSQLFSNGITESRFRKDIEDMVGSSNIELLWLFNTGNATVVFSAVPLAKLVRDAFLKYARTKKHRYEGVMVSFSHDPCERDLHLVSQIPGHANYIGGNSGQANGNGHNDGYGEGRPSRGSTFSTDSSGSTRRTSVTSEDYQSALKRRNTGSLKTTIGPDGWQTVKKRR